MDSDEKTRPIYESVQTTGPDAHADRYSGGLKMNAPNNNYHNPLESIVQFLAIVGLIAIFALGIYIGPTILEVLKSLGL